MDKFTYSSCKRGGKTHVKVLSHLNGMDFGHLQQGREQHITIIKPNTIQWYWQDHDDVVRTEIKDIVLKGKETDLAYTRESFRSDYSLWINYDKPHMPHNLYKVFDKLFECDMIQNPMVMLGYYGYPKAGDVHNDIEIIEALETRTPWLKVDLPYSIRMMRNRRNIIAYKEDVRHEAWNYFTGGGNISLLHDGKDDEYVRQVTLRLDEARKLPDSLRSLYNYYKIPYEMFSLDTGDYKRVFGIDKTIPNDYTSRLHAESAIDNYSDKIDKWVEDYLDKI